MSFVVQGFEVLAEIVKRVAAEAGFERAGIAVVRDFPELDYFPEWIAAGKAGEMKYLEARDDTGQLKRASLKNAAPWARSVVVCAINYNTAEPYSTQSRDPERGWISRYAWSREDYHESVLRRLRQVERKLLDAAAPAQIQTRCYVDTGPIVERVYAKYAGVGWIGKNTCVLNQQLGSWLFLGVILTSLELEPDIPAPDRCGSCTRCIEACPTDAFIAPYQLDATRCISYLTIEKRGEIPEGLRPQMGRHVFGCDICQDVCPWNRRAPISTLPQFQPRMFPSSEQNPAETNPLLQDESLLLPRLEWFLGLSESKFRKLFGGSPVKRAKWRGLLRNACIALGNSSISPGSPAHTRITGALKQLAACREPIIAESAQWALSRIQ